MNETNDQPLVALQPRSEGTTPAPATPKQRSIEQLRGVVSTLADFIWHGRTSKHLWTIPADPERDWDCILTDAIDELEVLRAAHAPATLPVHHGTEWQCRYVFQDQMCCIRPLGHEGDHAPAVLGSPGAVPARSCCEPAPDRSGRSCDKPKGHDGDHWTYGGTTLTWAAPGAVPEARPQETTEDDDLSRRDRECSPGQRSAASTERR